MSPADHLIRELIYSGRRASQDDVDAIVQQMATASFGWPRHWLSHRYVEVARRAGHAVERDADNLTAHWIKHVLSQQQWMPDTTAIEYLADMRSAIRSPNAERAVFANAAGVHVCVSLAPTGDMIPAERLGPRSGPLVLVVYSADHARLVTGFMVRDRIAATIPAGARWLI